MPPGTPRHPERLPDWQLPDGVDRALWEYMQTESIAEDYDEYFVGTHLLELDRAFLDRHFTRPGRLIDLGCGSGRLVVHFTQRGFDVVGVDLSENMIRVCQRKQQQSGLTFELHQANICDLGAIADESCDYAICMFSTLGMVVGQERRRKALAEFRRVLKPGGLFGLHLHNRWYNTFDPQGRRWLLGDLWKQLRRSPETGDKVQARYRGIPNLRLHIYTASEIRRELKRANFNVKEMMPLAASRTGLLSAPHILPGLRANGWLIMTAKK